VTCAAERACPMPAVLPSPWPHVPGMVCRYHAGMMLTSPICKKSSLPDSHPPPAYRRTRPISGEQLHARIGPVTKIQVQRRRSIWASRWPLAVSHRRNQRSYADRRMAAISAGMPKVESLGTSSWIEAGSDKRSNLEHPSPAFL
jgi:hypothetical protein